MRCIFCGTTISITIVPGADPVGLHLTPKTPCPLALLTLKTTAWIAINMSIELARTDATSPAVRRFYNYARRQGKTAQADLALSSYRLFGTAVEEMMTTLEKDLVKWKGSIDLVREKLGVKMPGTWKEEYEGRWPENKSVCGANTPQCISYYPSGETSGSNSDNQVCLECSRIIKELRLKK